MHTKSAYRPKILPHFTCTQKRVVAHESKVGSVCTSQADGDLGHITWTYHVTMCFGLFSRLRCCAMSALREMLAAQAVQVYEMPPISEPTARIRYSLEGHASLLSVSRHLVRRPAVVPEAASCARAASWPTAAHLSRTPDTGGLTFLPDFILLTYTADFLHF